MKISPEQQLMPPAPNPYETGSIADMKHERELVRVGFTGVDKSYPTWRGGKLEAIRIIGLDDVEEAINVSEDTNSFFTASFQLPPEKAENLRQFFNEHIVHPKGDERYNCHRFGYAVAGWPDAKPPRTKLGGLAQAIASGRLYMGYEPEQLDPVENPDILEPGEIYGIGQPGKIGHSLIGLGDGLTLSASGIHNPELIVAKGSELADFYHGDMFRILSPSTLRSSVYTPPK